MGNPPGILCNSIFTIPPLVDGTILIFPFCCLNSFKNAVPLSIGTKILPFYRRKYFKIHLLISLFAVIHNQLLDYRITVLHYYLINELPYSPITQLPNYQSPKTTTPEYPGWSIPLPLPISPLPHILAFSIDVKFLDNQTPYTWAYTAT